MREPSGHPTAVGQSPRLRSAVRSDPSYNLTYFATGRFLQPFHSHAAPRRGARPAVAGPDVLLDYYCMSHAWIIPERVRVQVDPASLEVWQEEDRAAAAVNTRDDPGAAARIRRQALTPPSDPGGTMIGVGVPPSGPDPPPGRPVPLPSSTLRGTSPTTSPSTATTKR